MSAQAGYDRADRQRWAPEPLVGRRPEREDFARDRARLVHSAALRRLSRKTQMHRPSMDDFVRNRLTHSLEVAQIGREFGSVLGCSPDVVDTACLAHDLGHPPFGHNGEAALNEVAASIGGFEGNAQSLRLVTRLEAKRVHPDGRSAGLNLTRASLDAATKYPWVRAESGSRHTKFGAYAEDLEVFTWLRRSTPADQPDRRCLEAQVMDWSDDVAYSVHDLEDAIASGIIDPRALGDAETVAAIARAAQSWYGAAQDHHALAEALQQVLQAGAVPRDYDGTRSSFAALKDTTSRLIGYFVNSVEVATRAQYGSGPLTRYGADLVIPEQVWSACVMLKAVSAHYILMSQDRQPLMSQQRALVVFLVEAFGERQERLDPLYLQDFHRATDDQSRRRVIIDQVASLTDDRAVHLGQLWS